MTEPDDVVSNRILLRHAKFLEKVKLLLPSQVDDDTSPGEESSAVTVSEKWSDKGDELLGIGATPKSTTEESLTDRHLLSANEKLRRQLLGRYSKKPGLRLDQSRAKPRYLSNVNRDERDDDDGESRTKDTKRVKQKTSSEQSASNDLGDTDESFTESGQQRVRKNKRPSSYLDEVLASRQRKKRHKMSKGDG